MKFKHVLLLLLLLGANLTFAQTLYFPPAMGVWQTTAPEELGWCNDQLNDLQTFLDQRDTKAFLLLKDGRIALEWYFDEFTPDSIWYWASAGKAMTATLIGIAQEEGLLSIDDPTSDYLGEGWTQLSPEQEAQITIRHQLTMTTGLNDTAINVDCTDPQCLEYFHEPGTRWAYHNAPYTLLGSVLEAASGLSLNQYLNSRVFNRIGGFGAYIPLGFNRIVFSRPRDMARFGLMVLANGQWNGNTILGDQNYLTEMANPSQNINPAYGYLWWLNGQESYQLPRLQFNFPGAIIPTAPADMFAGLGKNDQKVYIVPSANLVVVRLGEDAGEGLLALSDFDALLWEKIGELACNPTSTSTGIPKPKIGVSSNPIHNGQLQLLTTQPIEYLSLIAMNGNKYPLPPERSVDLSRFPTGLYGLEVKLVGAYPVVKKIVVQ